MQFFEGDAAAFKAQVESYDGLTLVAFGSPNCAACKRAMQWMPNVFGAHPDLHFIMVNAQQSTDIVDAYAIKTVPTLGLFKKVDGAAKLLDSTQPQNQQIVEDMLAKHQ